MIQKIDRYILTFYSTSGAIAVEKFCKENNIPGMEEKAMGKKKLFGNNINPSCKY